MSSDTLSDHSGITSRCSRSTCSGTAGCPWGTSHRRAGPPVPGICNPTPGAGTTAPSGGTKVSIKKNISAHILCIHTILSHIVTQSLFLRLIVGYLLVKCIHDNVLAVESWLYDRHHKCSSQRCIFVSLKDKCCKLNNHSPKKINGDKCFVGIQGAGTASSCSLGNKTKMTENADSFNLTNCIQ